MTDAFFVILTVLFFIGVYAAIAALFIPVAVKFWIASSAYWVTKRNGLDADEFRWAVVFAAAWPISMWVYGTYFLFRSLNRRLLVRRGITGESLREHYNRKAGIEK